VALTEEEISDLNECIGEFLAADYEAREGIVYDFVNDFKSACSRGVEFDAVTKGTVRTLSAALNCSQISL
jgi:hypothetical protein